MNFTAPKPTAVFDIECYRDYFLVYFRSVDGAKSRYFEMYDGHHLDIEGIERILRKWRVVSFNGNNYDVPMLSYALAGANCGQLKRASDSIILADLKPWEFFDTYDCQVPEDLDHIDLIEVAPGKAGLKIYGGRLHSRRMQDLPIEPDASITPAMRKVLVSYCGNDLQTTIDLWNELKEQIDLRMQMSDEYGIDLRSKSDAQIAEAVIKHDIEQIARKRVKKPDVRPGTFMYRPPEFLRFRTPQMQDLFNNIRRASFVVRNDGKVVEPKVLKDATVTMGNSVYRLGIGGLHSSEENISRYSDENAVLIDRDVTSYYPAIVINTRLAPRHLGRHFLDVYEGIVKRRVAAKRAGKKAVAESLKILVNGTFGKLGSPYSYLYSPDLMIQVTVTGQLSLLMAIERMELAGIHVVSANTDGFVCHVPRDKMDLYEAIIFDWECDTGFGTEETRYKALHSRDVNNYIAITMDGKVKLKGAYAPSGPGLPAASGLKKNPSAEICVEAAVAYLKDGKPVEDTIRACTDIRKFVTIRQVRGGAVTKNEGYLGKAVRWYYAEGSQEGIHYQINGNMVPKSIGAKPIMELPDELPDDIDYDWYARETYGILKDVGAQFVDPAFVGRSGEGLARLPDKKNLHIIDLSNGVALCGAAPPSPRVRWIEYESVPEGHRICHKCRRESEL